jgi:hypothetical protein
LGYERYPKERLDLFAGGMVLVLDDFRRLDVHGSPAKSWSADTPDKGHLAALRAFAKGVRTGEWPLSLADQLAATRVSFEVDACLRRPAA